LIRQGVYTFTLENDVLLRNKKGKDGKEDIELHGRSRRNHDNFVYHFFIKNPSFKRKFIKPNILTKDGMDFYSLPFGTKRYTIQGRPPVS